MNLNARKLLIVNGQQSFQYSRLRYTAGFTKTHKSVSLLLRQNPCTDYSSGRLKRNTMPGSLGDIFERSSRFGEIPINQASKSSRIPDHIPRANISMPNNEFCR